MTSMSKGSRPSSNPEKSFNTRVDNDCGNTCVPTRTDSVGGRSPRGSQQGWIGNPIVDNEVF